MNANANLWTLALAKPYGDGGYENSSRVMSPGFDSLSYPTTERQIIVEPPSCINDPAAAPCVGWTSFLALPHASILLNATTDRATREPNVPPPEPGEEHERVKHAASNSSIVLVHTDLYILGHRCTPSVYAIGVRHRCTPSVYAIGVRHRCVCVGCF